MPAHEVIGDRRLLVGTRGSPLALAQTETVVASLRALKPVWDVQVRVVRTTGDRDRRSSLASIGGTGVFVKELERALSTNAIDLAVHSMKDLPPRLEPRLVVAAVPRRADARDALVSRDSLPLHGLPVGARVGTGSARRRALLLRARPDLQIVEARGNVETRIGKTRDGSLDAVVLAIAGLERLGLRSVITEALSPELMLPSPGQGALAIEVRAGDERTLAAVASLDDHDSHACASAERGFLAGLGAGCSSPAAAYARLHGATIELQGLIASTDGAQCWQDSVSGGIGEAEALGERLAARLLSSSQIRQG